MRKSMILACTMLLAAMAAAQTNSAVPAGTALMVKLDTTLATFSNRPGDPFRGELSQPVMVSGKVVIPAGAVVEGRVTKVSEPRRISGKPSIAILPEAVIFPTGQRYFLDATLVDTNLGRGSDVDTEGRFKGSGFDKSDKIETGAGTAGGMLIGGLAGGPVGLVVGGAVAATATTTHWLAKHRSAILPAGTELTLELNRPLTLGTTALAPAANGGSK
ncbi:MAG TPA: hypothetical protein VIW68_05125 [Candidatus Sulfotelmatobacter sp.]